MTVSSIASRAEKAVKWSALTTVARFALQLGAQVALARVLGPGNYGVYGIGIAVLTFAAFLSSSAFSYNLMLQERIDERDIRFAFTWQALAGLAMGVVMLLGAPALASFFGDPRVQPMVQWLAAACVLTALSAPATCLLQRDLNFRALGLIQLASYAAGYLAVGLPLALAGWQAEALAIACVVQSAVTLAGAYAVRPHALRPLWRHAGGTEALVTGRAVFTTNVVNWLLGNLDRIIIGRVLNAHAVGLFTLAYNFSQIPNTLLVSAVQPTFLASGAKLANEPGKLAQAWLLVMACVLVLFTPIAVALALVTHDLVRLLYGPAWDEAAWVLALMFLCLPGWASWAMTTPVLWNTGRKHYEALLQLPILALCIPAWWLLAPQGLRWAVAVTAVAIYARSLVTIAAGLRALDLRWSRLLPLCLRGLLMAGWCGAAMRAAQSAVASMDSPMLSLAAGSLAGVLAGLLVAVALPQLLGEQARLALSRLLPFVRVAPVVPVPTPAATGARGQP